MGRPPAGGPLRIGAAYSRIADASGHLRPMVRSLRAAPSARRGTDSGPHRTPEGSAADFSSHAGVQSAGGLFAARDRVGPRTTLRPLAVVHRGRRIDDTGL